MIRTLTALCLAAVCATATAQTASSTMDIVRQRGVLHCGVTPNVPGFAAPDTQGNWRGLDADVCRAVAAAFFGDPSKVRFIPTTTPQRFTMLQSGDVDLLSRATTWTLTRESNLGLAFAGIYYYDGQAFMVRRGTPVTSAKQLDGATVCLQPGATTERNMADFARINGIRLVPVAMEDIEEVRAAFKAGRCDAYTTDLSSLASFRFLQGAEADRYVILPEVTSKEPLGPLVRKGDWKWFDLVRWTLYALVAAEELGITRANVDSMMASDSPDVRRFVGAEGEIGTSLGVDNRWAVNVIRAVGNFGEVWDRNITPLGVQRGINRLWTQGGLMYAPPMR